MKQRGPGARRPVGVAVTIVGFVLASPVTASEPAPRVGVEVAGGLIGGAAGVFSLGIVTTGVCSLSGAGSRSFGCLAPAVLGGYVGGAVGIPLGVWAGGNLMDGDGGFGWTLLGSLSGTALAATTLVLSDLDEGSPLWWTLLVGLPLAGAIVGYELSNEDDRPATTQASWSFAF